MVVKKQKQPAWSTTGGARRCRHRSVQHWGSSRTDPADLQTQVNISYFIQLRRNRRFPLQEQHSCLNTHRFSIQKINISSSDATFCFKTYCIFNASTKWSVCRFKYVLKQNMTSIFEKSYFLKKQINVFLKKPGLSIRKTTDLALLPDWFRFTFGFAWFWL